MQKFNGKVCGWCMLEMFWLAWSISALIAFIYYTASSSTSLRYPLHAVHGFKELNTSEVGSLLESNHIEVSKLGCMALSESFYIENYGNLEKTVDKIQNKTMTIDWCLTFCFPRKKIFAGLLKGNTCVCAFQLSYFAKIKALPGKCSTPCAGDNLTFCGGDGAVDAFLVRLVIQGTSVQKNFLESRFVGFFEAKFAFDDEDPLPRKVDNLSSCFLFCNSRNQPLAIFSHKRICACRKMTQKLNSSSLTLPTSTRAIAYRTLAEDKRCESLHLLSKPPLKNVGLVSFPGSGNTWTRYLIERATGVYTASIYEDPTLIVQGFLGEHKSVLELAVVVKDHLNLGENGMGKYDSAILLVRNPYNALVSNFHWIMTKSHVRRLDMEVFFLYTDFQKFVFNLQNDWLKVIEQVLLSKKAFLLVFFEDLVKNPLSKTKEIVNFISINSQLDINNRQERLLCLSQRIDGIARRANPKYVFDPFSETMKNNINKNIRKAMQLLNGNKHLLSYLRL